MDVFISGDRVNLVVLTEEAAFTSPWASWFNDQETTASMQQHHFPTTRAMQVQFFQNELSANSTKLQLGIQCRQTATFIGIISLSRIDWISRRSEIAVTIGNPEFRSLDYWLEANALLIDHAFTSLNLHRITGGSIRREVADLYVRLLDFAHEGIYREHAYKNGKYVDCYLFGRLATD